MKLGRAAAIRCTSLVFNRGLLRTRLAKLSRGLRAMRQRRVLLALESCLGRDEELHSFNGWVAVERKGEVDMNDIAQARAAVAEAQPEAQISQDSQTRLGK